MYPFCLKINKVVAIIIVINIVCFFFSSSSFFILLFKIWHKLFLDWALAKIIELHTERTQSILQSICNTLCQNYTRTYGNRSLAAINLFYMVSPSYTFCSCTLKSKRFEKGGSSKKLKMNGCSFQQVLRQIFSWFLSQHRKTVFLKGFSQITGKFERFKYFNIETNFLKNETHFQKTGIFFFNWKY